MKKFLNFVRLHSLRNQRIACLCVALVLLFVFGSVCAYVCLFKTAPCIDNQECETLESEEEENEALKPEDEENEGVGFDAIFRGHNSAKSLYELYEEPILERLTKELRVRFPEFNPEDNASHQSFLELLFFRNRTQEKFSGLPSTMRELEEVFNLDATTPLSSGKSPLYEWFAANPLGPWTEIVAQRRRYGTSKHLSSVFAEKKAAWRKFLDVCADDPLAAPYFVIASERPLYDIVPEEDLRDPWLREYVAGTRLFDEAWAARGSGYAGEVTEEGWETFTRKLDESREHFKKADALRPELPIAKVPLIEIAFLRHDENPLEYARAVLDICAGSSMVYTLQNFFLPRWFGSMEVEYALAKSAIENADEKSEAVFYGLEIWLRTLKKETDYPTFLRYTQKELFEAFKEKYERRMSVVGKRQLWFGVPEVYAAQAALLFCDYDFAEKIYRGNAEKFKGYAAYLKGIPETPPDISWIDPENYLREFSVGESRDALREAWSALCAGERNRAKSLFAAIVRDEAAPASARRVALDVYWRVWGNLLKRFYAFEQSETESTFAKYAWYSTARRVTPEFFEVLDLAKTIPEEFSRLYRRSAAYSFGVGDLLTQNNFFNDSQRERFVRILAETPEGLNIVSDKYRGELSLAAMMGETEKVRELLAAARSLNVDLSVNETPNPRGGVVRIPLHGAFLGAPHNHPEIARMLLDAGARCWDTPEERTLCNQSIAIHGFKQDEDTIEIIGRMLDRGYPINAKDSDGNTLLGISVTFSRNEQVRFLLERGADVEAMNEHEKANLRGRVHVRKIYEDFKKSRVREHEK